MKLKLLTEGVIVNKKITFLICVVLIGTLLTGCLAPNTGDYVEENSIMPNKFTVAFYNIWNGWRNPLSDETVENHTFSKVEGANFLESIDADFIGFSELCYTSADDLQGWTEDWDHSYSYLLSPNDTYPVGCTTEKPMQLVDKKLGGVGHGYIHIKTIGINFFVTHLSPGYKEEHDKKRIEEAKIIMEAIKPLLELGEPVILMGDFNARSISDKKYYDDKGISSDEGFSDVVYDAMQVFIDGGLIDLNDKMRIANSYVGSYYAPGDDQNERIDYFWVSPGLANICSKCEVRTDTVLKRVSDHFPITATFIKP